MAYMKGYEYKTSNVSNPYDTFESAYHFITAIRTIDVSVAPPPRGDAMAISAREVGVGLAGRCRTLHLVTTVAAVIIAITHPSLLDALAVPTSKLVRATCLICIL